MKTKKNLSKAVSLLVLFFLNGISYSQNVGINSAGATPNASAMLDIDASPSNDKGLLVPRVTLTQTTSNAPIGAGVATSLLIYNTANVNDVTPGYYYWDGAKWVRLLGNNNAWLLLGNAGTTAGTNFIGTTDAVDVVFKANNTERMRILSGGNVGVGTTAPSYPFHVYNSQNGVAYSGVENPNAGASAMAATISKSNAGMAGFWIASTAAGAYAEYGTTSSGGMYYTVYNASGDHAWRTTAVAVERMRLTSAGYLGIGCTAPQYALHVIGDIASSATVRSTNALVTGAISACSDIRYKKNIAALPDALTNILKLKGVNYYWRTTEFPDKKFAETKQIGFIAQEIEKIFPELVFTDKDGYKSVDYSRLTPLLVEAIKEQQAAIEKLKSENKNLQTTVNNVESENKKFKADYESRLKALEEILSAKAQR